MPCDCKSLLNSYLRTALLLALLLPLSGCGSGAEQLRAMGNQLAAETEALLAQFEKVKDESTARAALPELIASYDRIAATAKELESTAKRNFGRGYTDELQEELAATRESFSNRFQAHRKKLSKNLKAMQALQPLFKKMESNPIQ